MNDPQTIRDEIAEMLGWRLFRPPFRDHKKDAKWAERLFGYPFNVQGTKNGGVVEYWGHETDERSPMQIHPIPNTLDGIAALWPKGWGFEISCNNWWTKTDAETFDDVSDYATNRLAYQGIAHTMSDTPTLAAFELEGGDAKHENR